jgi:DNA mismatch repair ATPase MutS
MWSTQLAVAIERWRSHSGPAIAAWISLVGEFEALAALSGYSFEHPTEKFPIISLQRAVFLGEGIGHPLLPVERCVTNDLELDDKLRLVIVSGSNMSGKSTLLRTVGLNTVLALAGAPVRARNLVISELQTAASIRVQDSLQDGKSRFYAEITRLRQIVDLTSGPLPVLFLIDELLSGTNSHDREIGAAAIVRTLIDRGAIGLLTTHDLALAHIAETIQPLGANVHFADTINGGTLHFDYRLHPGVVKRSNALELMRSVGLKV